MHEGVLRRSHIDESQGKAQRIQERNEIQQSAESDSVLRYAANSCNTGVESMRGRQTEILSAGAAANATDRRDTTQQKSTTTTCEGRADKGKSEARRAERIARNVPQTRLAVDSDGERWQEVNDDDGQPEGAQENESGAEQFGGADCTQGWWRNFPTVAPVCRGNDGLSFDVSRLAIPFTRWRQESIKALGNSMVPQVVLELFKVIEVEILEE